MDMEELFKAAQECTREQHPDRWEWRGRRHLEGHCKHRKHTPTGEYVRIIGKPSNGFAKIVRPDGRHRTVALSELVAVGAVLRSS